tara:strand:+ start:118 stop:591 length:474 start_codon:yes stop_codon:yes gene_type:complete
MAEVSVGGISFKGGKMLGVLVALSTACGALYGSFEVWKQFQDMSEKIDSYIAPDLSGFDKRIELIQQEVSMLQQEMGMILEEVNLVASTAKELKDDLKSDVRQLEKDSRHTEALVDSVKNNTREELRLFEDSIKELENDLDLKINKALNNPLSAKVK